MPSLQFPNDNGLQMRTAAKLCLDGVAPEKLCPYDDSRINAKPDYFSYSFAKFFRIKTYYRLDTLEEVKGALEHGRPVVFGLHLKSKFKAASNGLVSNTGSPKGGHALCATGFDDALHGGCIEFLNSWGFGFGKGGFGYITYDDFETYLIEAWTADF